MLRRYVPSPRIVNNCPWALLTIHYGRRPGLVSGPASARGAGAGGPCLAAGAAGPPGPPEKNVVIIARYPMRNYRKGKSSAIAAAIGTEPRDTRFGGIAI